MALQEHISLHSRSLAVIMLFQWFQLKKLVGVGDEPSAPLRREVKYPRMLMVLGLKENRFD